MHGRDPGIGRPNPGAVILEDQICPPGRTAIGTVGEVMSQTFPACFFEAMPKVFNPTGLFLSMKIMGCGPWPLTANSGIH